MDNGIAIFSLGSNQPLAEKIVERLGVGYRLGKLDPRTHFSDGEMYTRFGENIRRSDVFLIQSTSQSRVRNGESTFERLLYAVGGAYHSSAGEITAVVPYLGYARQERKAKSREALPLRSQITALEAANLDRLITMDMHSPAIDGFFRKTRFDHLQARPVFLSEFRRAFAREIAEKKLIIVSPDVGGVHRADAYARALGTPLAIIRKHREEANEIEHMELIGKVYGKVALIIDDLFDTFGTVTKSSHLLLKEGATMVHAAATHGVFSGKAYENIRKSAVRRVFVTDTVAAHDPRSIPLKDRIALQKIRVVSVAEIFAKAIQLTSAGGSLSALFEESGAAMAT